MFSKDLAELSGNNPAQVRRDLMAVGYNGGNPQNGYTVVDLAEKIRQLLEPIEGIPMVLIGVGNLGRAILGYFSRLKPKFNLIAAFDTDETKVGRVIAGCNCFHSNEIMKVLKNRTVELGIITVPETYAQKAADVLIGAGVKGIVNFAPIPIKVRSEVYLENMQMDMIFEKAAFFARVKKVHGTT
jgi:redox-sensing transcriptional repressor